MIKKIAAAAYMMNLPIDVRRSEHFSNALLVFAEPASADHAPFVCRQDVSFKTWEIPIFMLMAVFGGLSGALFVQMNYYNTLWRRR